MTVARQFLHWLTRLECVVAVLALILSASALMADIIAREVFRVGLFGSLRVAVYSTAIAALFGFGICVAQSAHIRVNVFDKITPETWQATIVRIGDVISLAICAYFAYWALQYVIQTYEIGETDTSLNLKVWPMQTVLFWMFFSGGLRYALFAVFPVLRPEEAEVVT